MDVAAAGAGYSIDGAKSSLASLTGGQTLGKDAFMKLLAAQLQHQDPLDPVQNSDFVAQLAQFSNLEYLSGMSETLSTVLTMNRLSQANGLIGKRIEYVDAETGALEPALVSAVEVEGDQVRLDIGGRRIALEQVRSIQA